MIKRQRLNPFFQNTFLKIEAFLPIQVISSEKIPKLQRTRDIFQFRFHDATFYWNRNGNIYVKMGRSYF